MTTPATTCCPDCQTMHRTPAESAVYHANIAIRHARRATRWNLVAMTALAVTFALLAFRSFTS